MATPRTDLNNTGCDVLVTGGYFCDLIITGLTEMPHLGYEVWGKQMEIHPGASFIPAVALHRLGIRVAWPCYFGNDLFSRFVREQALREGLNDRWFQDLDRALLNFTFSFSFTNERAFVSYTDKPPAPSYPDLIRQLRPSWIMLMKLWQGRQLIEIVNAARECDSRVFMDCQAHKTNLNDPEVKTALSLVDVFSPNSEEALQLTNAKDLETALADLANLTPLVVIKLGQEGAIARQGDRVINAPGIKVNAVDTTGAGDNFDCGFVYAQIRGYSLEDSLYCANLCGGLSTRSCGGTASAPTKSELELLRSGSL